MEKLEVCVLLVRIYSGKPLCGIYSSKAYIPAMTQQLNTYRSICICEKNVYIHVQKHMYRNIHSSIFIIAINWKQLKRSPVVEQINKFWCIHTMEYSYVRDKKKEADTTL